MRILILILALTISSGVASANPVWYPTKSGDYFALYDEGKLIGWLNKRTGEYNPRLENGTDGPSTVPPISPPAEFRPLTAVGNNGVDLSKIRNGPAFTKNGREISRKEAADALTDDSKLIRLTVVGSESMRKQCRADLASSPALAAWKGKILVQDYAPDAWVVRLRGLAEGITIQSPDGKAIAYAKTYDGPDALVKLLTNQPTVSPPFGMSWLTIGLIGIAAYFILKKKE
jgi:hypothetical protein